MSFATPGPVTTDLNFQLSQIGAGIIESFDYPLTVADKANLLSYYANLPDDQYGEGRRRRVYVRLEYSVETGSITRSENQVYSQTYDANDMNGDEPRQFAKMSEAIFEDGPIGKIVNDQIEILSEIYRFETSVVNIGVHALRYIALKGEPTFSSPIWLHKDDEPVVVLTVMSASPFLVGGDTLLSRDRKAIDRSIALKPFQSAVLSRETMHMVTPMESASEHVTAWRDILLVTIEEDDKIVRRRTMA